MSRSTTQSQERSSTATNCEGLQGQVSKWHHTNKWQPTETRRRHRPVAPRDAPKIGSIGIPVWPQDEPGGPT